MSTLRDFVLAHKNEVGLYSHVPLFTQTTQSREVWLLRLPLWTYRGRGFLPNPAH